MKTMMETRNRTAFTLVELLVIIGIIALLLGILIPGVGMARRVAMEKSSISTLALIGGGCEQFKNDFGYFPPSQTGAMSSLKGAQLIAVYMTGYASDSDDDAKPDADLSSDDGMDGFGFRIKKRSPAKGPYNGCENIKTKMVSSKPVFVDSFDNTILYYRYEESVTPHYVSSHNTGMSSSLPSSTYLNNAANKRKDFILLTPGSDSTFENDIPDSDEDITNL